VIAERFPTAPGSKEAPASGAASTSAVPARVLVIDDEPVIGDFFSKLLEPNEFDVVAWPSGEAALGDFVPGLFELAIVDKNLRGMTGIEVMRELKTRDPLIEVILITGYASLETAIEALQLGAFDYIEKPFPDIALLLQKARRAVERRRLSVTNLKLVDNLKRTNAELLQRNAELVEVQEQLLAQLRMASVGQLAAWMGEEIINPISIIKTNVYLVDDHLRASAAQAPQGDEVQREVHEIKQAIESLVSMIRRMQHFSFAARNEPRPVSLQGCIERAVELAARNPPRKDIPLRVEIAPSLPPMRGSPALLTQALANLLQNALEAVEVQGLVEVRAWSEDGQARVSIRDTGVGISREDLARVLKPFFTTKETGQHVGLGLNLAEEIVRRHGGSLRIESELGKGTTVVILLPGAGTE
jgi:two-component system NtrC family sensor kinase